MRKLAGHQSQLCTLRAGSRCPQPCCQSRSGRFQTPRRRKTALEHGHPRLQHQSTDTVWAPALTENCSTIELTAPLRRRALCTSLFRMSKTHVCRLRIDCLAGLADACFRIRFMLKRGCQDVWQDPLHYGHSFLASTSRICQGFVSFASNVEAKALRSPQQDSSPTQRLQERNRKL